MCFKHCSGSHAVNPSAYRIDRSHPSEIKSPTSTKLLPRGSRRRNVAVAVAVNTFIASCSTSSPSPRHQFDSLVRVRPIVNSPTFFLA